MEVFYKPSEAAKFLNTTNRVVKYMKKTGKLVPDIVDATGHFFYSQSQLLRIKNGTTVQNGTIGTTVQVSNVENGANVQNGTTTENKKSAGTAENSQTENNTNHGYCQADYNLDEQIAAVKRIDPQELLARSVLTSARNDEIICLCGTGVKPFLNNNNVWTYHCFKCAQTYTNINYLAQFFHLDPRSDFVEIIKKSCYLFNIPLPQTVSDEQSQKDYGKFYYVAQKNLVNWLKSVGGSWRAFTLDTLQHFNCGFANGRVIIPYNNYPIWRVLLKTALTN